MIDKFADMSPKEKAAHFGRMVWSDLPIVAEIKKVLDLARFAHGTSLAGKVSLIHGADGLGKTVGCDHYFRRFATSEGGTYVGTNTRFGEEASLLDATWVTTTVGNRERRNMIKVDVSPRVTGNGLLADMVRGLTNEEPPRLARHDMLLRSIKKILVGLGAEVLVLDNAHRAVERNISIGASDAGDIIAEIAKKTGVEIVLVGTDLAKTLFSSSKELQPLQRCVVPVHAIEAPGLGSTAFEMLLERFQKRLPFPRRSDLTSDAVMTRLFTFCGGNVEKLAVFLQTTVLLALLDKVEFIDLGTLANAYDRLYIDAGPNPFMARGASRKSGAPAIGASA